MTGETKATNGTEIDSFTETLEDHWDSWNGMTGPPVPAIIDRTVWETLLEAVEETSDPTRNPRVFRLLMKRRVPRHVVDVSEITRVCRNKHGILRWEEGEYPPTSAPLRKGGNAFIRGDTQLRMSDAWWMGREQTDLRILLAKRESVRVSAWWSRGGSSGLSGKHETDGEVWPVRLLIK